MQWLLYRWWERASSIQWTGGWVSRRAGLEALEWRITIHWSSSPQASCCIHCAVQWNVTGAHLNWRCFRKVSFCFMWAAYVFSLHEIWGYIHYLCCSRNIYQQCISVSMYYIKVKVQILLYSVHLNPIQSWSSSVLVLTSVDFTFDRGCPSVISVTKGSQDTKSLENSRR